MLLNKYSVLLCCNIFDILFYDEIYRLPKKFRAIELLMFLTAEILFLTVDKFWRSDRLPKKFRAIELFMFLTAEILFLTVDKF